MFVLTIFDDLVSTFFPQRKTTYAATDLISQRNADLGSFIGIVKRVFTYIARFKEAMIL